MLQTRAVKLIGMSREYRRKRVDMERSNQSVTPSLAPYAVTKCQLCGAFNYNLWMCSCSRGQHNRFNHETV
jgi:hypothetical protein